MLEEPCRTNAWSIPISSPISKEDTCIRDIKKLLVRPGSPRWAHFMVGSVHHSPWIREVCHFVEVMAPVGLEWFSVGSRRLKNTLVGGFKHFLFSVSYMGQSFPLTNSYFSRLLKPPTSTFQELPGFCYVLLLQSGPLVSITEKLTTVQARFLRGSTRKDAHALRYALLSQNPCRIVSTSSCYSIRQCGFDQLCWDARVNAF